MMLLHSEFPLNTECNYFVFVNILLILRLVTVDIISKLCWHAISDVSLTLLITLHISFFPPCTLMHSAVDSCNFSSSKLRSNQAE